MKMKKMNVFIRVIVPVLTLGIISNTQAGTCTSPCVVNGSTPEIRMTGSSIGWAIRTLDSSGNLFTIGNSIIPGVHPFVIQAGGLETNFLLTLGANNKVGINTPTPNESLEIANGQPGFRMDDTTTGEGSVDLEMIEHRFLIQGESNQDIFNIDTRAPINRIFINEAGNVGLGVVNATHNLQIGGNGTVKLDPAGTDFDWEFGSGMFGLWFTNQGQAPFRLGNNAPGASLAVEANTGDVGVGTSTPAAPLHVLRRNGTARINVEERSGTTDKRVLYSLVNNGEIRFSMRTTDTSVPAANRIWDFLMATDGFNITRVGSGGAEMLVGNNGSVRMGNKNGGASGFDPTFYLDPLGNLTIDGAVTAGSLSPLSDMNAKENFASIDKSAVLAKLGQLPVSKWNFIGDDDTSHIGPMAQDFYAAFGLGVDDKHIGVLDASGVIIAGMQALLEKHNQSVTRKDAEISELQQHIALLKQRLTRLEAQQERLSQLEELLRDLTVKGEVAQR